MPSCSSNVSSGRSSCAGPGNIGAETLPAAQNARSASQVYGRATVQKINCTAYRAHRMTKHARHRLPRQVGQLQSAVDSGGADELTTKPSCSERSRWPSLASVSSWVLTVR